MQLPKSSLISVSKLSSVFKSTSATYKFYWFWAILESIENKKSATIPKKELFSRMISLSWYTVNYFHISFGKQDLIQNAIEQIKLFEQLNIDEKPDKILNKLVSSNKSNTNSTLKHFDLNVPHKFLSPWLGSGSKSEVYNLSKENHKNPPYALSKDFIQINPDWFNYFFNNMGILKSFCFWNLTLFLQSRNPNIPGIPSKIQRPILRNSLNKHKTHYWDIVIKEMGPIKCIYTNELLNIGTYDVEHFIPYQFVAHDLMWNLIPADSSFNSKKGDKLPKFNTYFDSFYDLQLQSIEIIKSKSSKNKFLQDYLLIFPDLKLSKQKFEELIKPMLTIAHNNGFQYLNS